MNKIKNKDSYGYPSLGLITKFYRNCIGDEPLIHIETFLEEKGEHPYKERESITKAWDRLCEEKYCTYEYYKSDSSNGLSFFVESFFYYMNSNYKLSIPLIKLINSTYYSLFDLLTIHTAPIIPDLPTKEITKSAIFYSIISWVKELSEQFKNWDKILDFYFSDDLNYKTIFNGIKNEINKPWEQIYAELDDSVEIEKIKIYQSGNYVRIAERFEKIIKDSIQSNNNPTWYNFWIIFSWAPDDLNEQLLEVYLLNNYKQALKDVFEFTEEELIDIKNDIIKYLRGGDEKDILKNYKDIYDEGRLAAIHSYMTFFKIRSFYLKKDKDYLTSLKNKIIKIGNDKNIEIKHSFDFFEPWLFAYKAVAERRFGEAQKFYKQAFEKKYLAGDYILQFLKQAFVVELYCNGTWIKSRQAAELDTNNKTPICEQAQKYWNYGYALGLFDKPATDTFLESFRIYQNFYNEFPFEIFEYPDNVRKIQIQEIANEMGVFFDNNEVPEQKLDRLYNLICKYTDEDKEINERLKHPFSNKDINNKENRLYTPFSLCIIFGSMKEEFLTLAENWIEFKNLDLGKRNFNNSTALLEAITQYKHIRYSGNESKTDLIQRYHKLIIKILDKSKPEDFTETKIHKIHVFQEAIDSFDLEIIKMMIDKGLDVNKTLIDADELSPLYYAINRKERIRFGFKNFKKKLEENPYNITWNNLDVPGLTALDKEANREIRIGNIRNVSFDFEEQMMKVSFAQMYGNENTFDMQLKELDQIIEYLISKTDDVDFFIKTFDKFQGINSLFLAAEFNDVKVCELLLEKGASPTISLGETLLCTIPNEYNSYDYVYSYNSFIYRLIYFNSWDMLELFLTKYIEMARQSMVPNEYGITPIIYFLYYTRTLDNSNELRKQFISKFVKAGANLNQGSILGSANQVIKMLEYYEKQKK